MLNTKIIAVHGDHNRALMLTDATLAFMDKKFGYPTDQPELPVTDGESIVPVINRLIMLKHLFKHYALIVSVNDWHSHKPLFDQFNVVSESRYEGRHQAYIDTIDTYYGTDRVWPSESLAGTYTADVHPGINRMLIDVFIRKGTDSESHPYGGFQHVVGKSNGLSALLKTHEIKQIDHVGLAENEDFCLGESARQSLQEGFITTIIADGTKGVDIPEGKLEQDRKSMQKAGIIYLQSTDIMDRYKVTAEYLDKRTEEFLSFQREQLKALCKAMGII